MERKLTHKRVKVRETSNHIHLFRDSLAAEKKTYQNVNKQECANPFKYQKYNNKA